MNLQTMLSLVARMPLRQIVLALQATARVLTFSRACPPAKGPTS